MLQQTFKLYDANDNQILTRTRFIENNLYADGFAEEVMINDDCYALLFSKIENEAEEGEWVEIDAQTQVYSRDYREETCQIEWRNNDAEDEIAAGSYVVENTFVDYIDEALDVVKSNADGSQYVRVFLHDDGTISPHFFSSHQWNDIDQSGQIELCSFEQSDLLENVDCGKGDGVHDEECGCEPESFFDTMRGEDWLNDMREEIEQELLKFEGEF